MPKTKERNVELEIALANAELERHGIAINIELREGRKKLNLRGRFPAKKGDRPPHHQRISLDDTNSSRAGIAYAKEEAMRLGLLLDQKRFTWDEVGRACKADTCEQAIAKFEAAWRKNQNGTAESKAKRFRNLYWYRGFSKLPQASILSAAVLEATLSAGWEENSASKKKAAQNLAALAAFANITDVNLPGGKYSTDHVKRSLPEDSEIESAINRIAAEKSNYQRSEKARDGWQWIAGMMAAYGLRDHEAFFCSVDWEEIEGDRWLVCRVAAEANTLSGKTKTGARKILPLPSHWVELWELDRVRRPNINAQYGDRTAKQFKRMKIPFGPYDLRHAWSVRASLSGIPDLSKSSMMGHSIRTNQAIYLRHARQNQIDKSFVDAVRKAST